MVFLDISKAFDRVWHKGLLHKLKLAGIEGQLLNWFSDYLSDRYQRVIINGQQSKWGKISAGVPQGSVLGPMLFLVFINDITLTVSNCNIRLFADDTCLFLEVSNREDCKSLLNEDLRNIDSWSNQWLIKFSAEKTKALTVSNKRDAHLNLPLSFKGQNIEEVSSHTYLGVVISNSLKWTAHVSDVASKARKKLSLMLPLKYKLDRKSLEIMYNSFVRSSMDYASVVWGGTYQSDLDKLEKINIDAMRIVTGATAKSNRDALYEDTCWQTITERIDTANVCMVFKILHGHCPFYLERLLVSNPQRSRYRLRSENLIQPPFARLESFKRSFIPHAVALWNRLNESIKSADSFKSFKQKLKSEVVICNPLFYIGARWSSIQHARLRIGCSALNDHLCTNLHVIQSSQCKCGHPIEDNNHYFFDCILFENEREHLLSLVNRHCQPTTEIFLNGHESLSLAVNMEVLIAVHEFIVKSGRFK